MALSNPKDPTVQKLCAVLLGRASTPEVAKEFAGSSSACPYVASYSSSGCLTVGVYVLPEAKRWWIEIPAARPGLLGLESAALGFVDSADAESAWSRGEVQPTLPTPPCGSNCTTCPQYRQLCSGCPASQYANPADQLP